MDFSKLSQKQLELEAHKYGLDVRRYRADQLPRELQIAFEEKQYREERAKRFNNQPKKEHKDVDYAQVIADLKEHSLKVNGIRPAKAEKPVAFAVEFKGKDKKQEINAHFQHLYGRDPREEEKLHFEHFVAKHSALLAA